MGPHDGERLPDDAYAGALASLPAVGPAWLVSAIGRHGPRKAWELVRAGELSLPPASSRSAPARAARARGWAQWAERFDVGAFWRRCQQAGIRVTWYGHHGYPGVLAGGAAPAGVLFMAGKPSAVGTSPAVAVVGTRDCTSEGASIAFELGYELARAGVCVVSGLALGIDGAAHAGAVTALREAVDGERPAPTVGVAASGVDVVYPAKHAGLWLEVSRLGAVISETPPGSPAQSWRFPSRNRLIAGLANLVVVVECHAKGGSWHTVDAATRNGTDVAAVPGSVRSAASVGTNALIHDGAIPVRHAQDVLDALSCFEPALPARPRAAERPGHQATEELGPVEAEVLRALSGRPLCLDDVVERSGLPVAAVVVGLEGLLGRRRAREDGGWWTRL